MSSIKQIGNTIPRLCRKMTWLKLILATFSHEMRHTDVESLVRAYTIYLFCSAQVPQVNLCFRFTVFLVCACFPVTPFVILKATRSYNTVFVSDDDYIKVHSNFTARNIIVDHQVGVNDILKLILYTLLSYILVRWFSCVCDVKPTSTYQVCSPETLLSCPKGFSLEGSIFSVFTFVHGV